MPCTKGDEVPMLHCPDCGRATLRLIETTEPDGSDEYKQVLTCDECENIVYIVRNLPNNEEGENMISHWSKVISCIENGDYVGASLCVKNHINSIPKECVINPGFTKGGFQKFLRLIQAGEAFIRILDGCKGQHEIHEQTGLPPDTCYDIYMLYKQMVKDQYK